MKSEKHKVRNDVWNYVQNQVNNWTTVQDWTAYWSMIDNLVLIQTYEHI